MAAPITTTTQVPGPVDVVYQQELLTNAAAVCPYFAGSQPASIAEHSGSLTAKWRLINELTKVSTPLAELTGNVAFPVRDSVQVTASDITEEVKKYGNFMYLNETTDLINPSNVSMGYARVFGINAGESLNGIQATEMESNSTVRFAVGDKLNATGPTNTVNSPMAKSTTRDVLRACNNFLKAAKGIRFTPMAVGSERFNTSPIRAAYWGFCHVDVEEDIRVANDFYGVEQYASQIEVVPGEFGTSSGIRWISSTEANVSTGAGAVVGTTGLRDTAGNIDVYTSVIIAMDSTGSVGLGAEHIKEVYVAGDRQPGIQMISKPKGSAGTADPLNELSSLGWKSWLASKVLQQRWALAVQSGASAL